MGGTLRASKRPTFDVEMPRTTATDPTPSATLFATPLSANARKPLAVAYHLGVAFELREVDVYQGEGRAPEFLRVNPAGKVPVLIDGDLVLTESNAIIEYLAERYGGGRLHSSLPARRAIISSWMFWEAAHWQPVLTRILSAHVGHALRPDLVATPADPPPWDNPELAPLLDRIGGALRQHAFLAGDELTLADFSVAGLVTYFRRCDFPFDAHPLLHAWYRRIEDLPSWRRSATELWSS